VSNKVVVPMDERPRCQHRGCKTHAQHTGNYRLDGTPIFRKWCTNHHYKKTAEKKGLTTNEWINSFHEYRKHRKDHCENRDSRLGFKCNYKIRHSAQLQVDHKNGKPDDNRPCNLQTLCANCHTYKTHVSKDYASPGRKALRESKKKGMFTQLVDK